MAKPFSTRTSTVVVNVNRERPTAKAWTSVGPWRRSGTSSQRDMRRPERPGVRSVGAVSAAAKAPTVSLPAEIVAREKTGFSVPIGAWMNSTAREAVLAGGGRPAESKGLMSRRWSRTVLHSFAKVGWA